jgi:hypothetical protein
MANIDISVRSLWGAAIFRNYTVSDAVTIDDVIALIAADDNLDTNFYKLTLSRDHSITDVAYGDSSTTLADLGVRTGDTFLSKSKAAELFKTDNYRAQLQKLEIAQAKRQADGDTTKPYYDIQNIYSYAALHSSPLAEGRPWVGTAGSSPTYAAGLYKTTYAGYFADNVNFFATATPTTYGSNPATSVQTTAISEAATDDGNIFSCQWLGYFKPTTTETYTFFLSSDDASYMWIGNNAITGFTTSNATVNNGGEHSVQEQNGSFALTSGVYYPIRIQFGENGGGDQMQMRFSTPTITKTSNVTGLVFYNSATNAL